MSMSSSIYDPIGYIGAIIALNAVVLPAVVVLSFLVFRHVKTEGDRVRSGFKWLHAALFTLFIATALDTATHAYILAWPLTQTKQSLRSANGFREYTAISGRLSSAQVLTMLLAEAALVFCVQRLVASTAPRRVFGYVITAALGLAVAVAIAQFGFSMWVAGETNHASDGTKDRYDELLRFIRYRSASASLFLAASILMMLAAAGVFVQAMKARKTGTWVVRRLAVVAGLVLFIMVWRFVYTTVSLSGTLLGTHPLDITGIQFADIILAVWGSFGAMVMIYLVGKKREGGMWSENRGKVDRSSEEGLAA